MKKDVARWVAKSAAIHITMDFVTGLPTGIKSKHNGVWVVMDRLTKSAYFMAISDKDGAEIIA